MRAGDTLSVFVDGVPQALTLDGSASAGSIDIGNSARFTIGYQSYPMQRYDFGAIVLTGAIDEVRLWAVARTEAAIADGMHHYVFDGAPGLVGHWTFDDQSLAGWAINDVTLTSGDQIGYVPSEVDIEPPGSPYLVTQAQLMDDYVPDLTTDSGFRNVDGYRVMIGARDGNGNPIGAEITVWAADADSPASLYTFDGNPSEITDQQQVTLTTNGQGEVSFVIDAALPDGQPSANPLLCPTIKVRASFMQDGELVVVAPDRHAHAILANVTGDQLTGQAPLSSGKTATLLSTTATLSSDDISAVAQAINHVMTAAVEHSVQPGHPLTRKRNEAIDTALPQPYTPMYENLAMLVAPYDFHSNAISTHYLPVDQAVARILAAESMPTPYWQLSFGAAGTSAQPTGAVATAVSFTQLSLRDRNSVIAGLAEISPLDDLTQLVTSQPDAVDLTSLANDAFAELTAATQRVSFWNSVASASRIVFDTVEKETTGAEGRIKVLVAYLIDSAGKAINAVLLTVRDAVDFVVALLQRLKVKVAAILDFVKTAFNWTDILTTQQVLESALTQLPGILTTAVSAMESFVDGKLAELQDVIGNQFDQWIAALADRSANSESAAAKSQPPQPIQHKYVMSMFAHNAGSVADEDQDEQGLRDALLSASAVGQLTQKFPSGCLDGAQDALAQAGLGSYLVSMEALLDAAMAKLLAGLDTVATDVVGLVRGAAQAFFNIINEMIEALGELAQKHIVLPWLTHFYEKVLLDGTGQLSLVSLISLAAAVPLTITYNLASGQPGSPFSAADAQTVRAGTWVDTATITAAVQHFFGDGASTAQALTSSAGAAELENTAGKASAQQIAYWGLNYSYSVATAFWGVCCFLEDRSPLPVPKCVTSIKLMAQFVAVATGFPMFSTTPGAGDSRVVADLLVRIWAGGIVALASNCTAAASTMWSENEDPWITGVYGVIQLYGYLVIGSVIGVGKHEPWDAVLVTGLGVCEAYEWIPQLGKLLAEADVEPATKEFILHELIPWVEAFAYTGVTMLSTFLTTAQIGTFYKKPALPA